MSAFVKSHRHGSVTSAHVCFAVCIRESRGRFSKCGGQVGQWTHHSSHSVTEIPQTFRELTSSQMFGGFLGGDWVSFCGGRLTKNVFIRESFTF